LALWRDKAKKRIIRLEFLPPQPSSLRSVEEAARHPKDPENALVYAPLGGVLIPGYLPPLIVIGDGGR
jgi:hypothetical protein